MLTQIAPLTKDQRQVIDRADAHWGERVYADVAAFDLHYHEIICDAGPSYKYCEATLDTLRKITEERDELIAYWNDRITDWATD